MTDVLQNLILRSPAIRRATWRLSRRLYRAARGEPRRNTIEINGEAYVQAQVSASVPLREVLVVCDVGANKGQWTTSMLRAAAAAGRDTTKLQLHSFEPVAATREQLAANIAQAGPLGRCVQIHDFAVSDGSGPSRMSIHGSGTNSLHSPDERSPTIPVTRVSLDEFARANKVSQFHLVKSDAEGHDMRVILGARDLLQRQMIDVFQFEYNHRWVFSRHLLKDVFDLAETLPYSVARIMPRHIELIGEWHPELERFFEANYLLVRDEVTRWFDARRGCFDGSNVYR